MEKFLFVLGVMLITALIAGIVFFGLTPQGRIIWHQYRFSGDRITPEQVKEVEDTCRAMIASWEADLQTYMDLKDTDKDGAEVARLSANRTADMYNEYLLMNTYVFGETLPDGIYAVIESIE
jgi:hypothetical protein